MNLTKHLLKTLISTDSECKKHFCHKLLFEQISSLCKTKIFQYFWIFDDDRNVGPWKLLTIFTIEGQWFATEEVHIGLISSNLQSYSQKKLLWKVYLNMPLRLPDFSEYFIDSSLQNNALGSLVLFFR